MTTRVLDDNAAALEEGGHALGRGERADGVCVCVEEEEGGAGLGLLEAWSRRLVCVHECIRKGTHQGKSDS
jgi:hypothetical protein